MRKLTGYENGTIEAGKVYWLGASDSPGLVLVTAVENGLTYYVNDYQAHWQHDKYIDEARIGRANSSIFADLVNTAEATVTKQMEAMRASGYPWAEAASKNRMSFVGGKIYEFNHRYVCNCCGDDFDAPNEDNRSSCCGQDWRENRSAESFIGRTI